MCTTHSAPPHLFNVNFHVVYSALELIRHSVKNGLQSTARSACRRRVQHTYQPVAFVVQLAQRILPLVLICAYVERLRCICRRRLGAIAITILSTSCTVTVLLG